MPFALPDGRPAVMGVLNVTPDSFSDGGLYADPAAAVARGLQMVAEGADLVDVGGESTRPGADAVGLDEELRRVLPVVERLAREGVAVSIDTSKPEVARCALEAGASVVNDVTGLGGSAMRAACLSHRARVCVMHMQGSPRDMQAAPRYDDVVAEVFGFLTTRADEMVAGGFVRERIWLDPGIGFGKTLEHNLALLGALPRLVAHGLPVLIGVSRKSFLGRLLGDAPTHGRLEGGLAAQVLAQCFGVRIIRTHDVLATRRAIQVTGAIMATAAEPALRT